MFLLCLMSKQEFAKAIAEQGRESIAVKQTKKQWSNRQP